MNNLKPGYLTVNVLPEFHRIALKFAQQQDTVTKSKQVYLNTLAVLATRDLVEESSFATDLDLGDSWNPAVRCFHNVADLVIPGIGKLECIPITEDTERLAIPKEVRTDRIAYVVILLSKKLDRAQLLGFTPQSNLSESVNEISLAQLQPIEDLIDYLFDLELADDYLLSDEEVANAVRERLKSDSISEISAQFERIIRTVDAEEQQNTGVNVLAELMGINIEPELVLRSPDLGTNLDNSERAELENLAQSLLSKLRGIWAVEQILPEDNEDSELLNTAIQRWQQLRQQKDEVVTKLSQYLGDREGKVMNLLRESIYTEDKYDRNDRALRFLLAGNVSSGTRNKSPEAKNAPNLSLDAEELEELLGQLWDKLGI